MASHIEKLCLEKNIKLTENRKIIAKVISKSTDHPDVEEVYNRASKINNKIGMFQNINFHICFISFLGTTLMHIPTISNGNSFIVDS